MRRENADRLETRHVFEHIIPPSHPEIKKLFESITRPEMEIGEVAGFKKERIMEIMGFLSGDGRHPYATMYRDHESKERITLTPNGRVFKIILERVSCRS